MVSLIAAQKMYVPLGIDLGVACPDRRSPRTKWAEDSTELRTYGDHVRAKRLVLGLFRREVAEMIGVDETTIYNWESNRNAPAARVIQRVVEFLGYCPPFLSPPPRSD
jgi:ribosome-binding protein aMBF1 (putative translation factor)